MKSVWLGFMLLLAIPLTCARADTTQAGEPDVCAVLGGDILLGGWVDGRWAADETVVAHLNGGESYKLYTLTRQIGLATASKPEKGIEAFRCSFRAEITPSPTTEDDWVGLTATWDPAPRTPKIESTDQKVYHDLIRDVLQMHRIAEPEVKITGVVRVDLEGDGTDEVLISATNLHPKGTETSRLDEGAYSLILLRKIVGSEVKTVIIDGEFRAQQEYEFPLPPPGIIAIAAVLDANGDGVMEIFLAYEYYEGGGMDVFEVKGLDVKRVFRSGWGA